MQRLTRIELVDILFTCILFMSASLVSLAQSASPSTESRLDAIVSRGTLRFGIPGDYPPFGRLDKTSGQWTGIDVDEAAGMAKALGVRLVIVRTSWPSLLPDLKAGQFDIAGGGISITMERQKDAFFSTPILQDGKTPITRCENVSRFSSLADIDKPGVRVITPPGGTNESFDRSHLTRAKIIVNDDNQSIFKELVAGRADLMITDAIETRWQHALHPELCSVHPEHPFNFVEKAYMMPRDIALQQWVNTFLHLQENTGELNAVLDRWLH
jgi:cyclohexadienyl dehydratase